MTKLIDSKVIFKFIEVDDKVRYRHSIDCDKSKKGYGCYDCCYLRKMSEYAYRHAGSYKNKKLADLKCYIAKDDNFKLYENGYIGYKDKNGYTNHIGTNNNMCVEDANIMFVVEHNNFSMRKLELESEVRIDI